jgi:hypothetical protein
MNRGYKPEKLSGTLGRNDVRRRQIRKALLVQATRQTTQHWKKMSWVRVIVKRNVLGYSRDVSSVTFKDMFTCWMNRSIIIFRQKKKKKKKLTRKCRYFSNFLAAALCTLRETCLKQQWTHRRHTTHWTQHGRLDLVFIRFFFPCSSITPGSCRIQTYNGTFPSRYSRYCQFDCK